jgi:tRNA(adenine34) deaminase
LVTEPRDLDFTIHFVVWPQSMQVPSQDLLLRNQALVSLLQSISSESPATMSS